MSLEYLSYIIEFKRKQLLQPIITYAVKITLAYKIGRNLLNTLDIEPEF